MPAERVGEVACDPSWGGLQRMQVRVLGAELGALQVEIMRGGFISSSKVGTRQRRRTAWRSAAR